MATRLSEADRRAVDSLLDSDFTVVDSGSPQTALDLQRRLTAARGWLNLIATMPAEDPPANLVAATLARIQPAAPTPAAPADTPAATSRL